MKLYRKKTKVLTGIAVVILGIVLLNVFQKDVRSFFYCISSPVQRVLWRAGKRTSDFFSGIIKIESLKNELDELSSKNQELLSQIITLQELEKENNILREALGIELEKEFKLALTQVIGKDMSQDFLLIDKGTKDGISENMPVITQQKVLVGRIGETYDKFSKVMLISNKDSSFDAKVNDISGIIKGQGNFKILFDLIPREKDLFQGDIVVTSAFGGFFPEGLLIGEIKEVRKSDVEPFQQAEINPDFNISQTEELFIILEF